MALVNVAQLLKRDGMLTVSIPQPHARAAALETVGEFNIGDADDYRIPDCGLLTPGPDALYLPTAALAGGALEDRRNSRLREGGTSACEGAPRRA